MDALYLWPESPALSLLVLYAVSAVLLWAAREPMLQLLRGLGRGLEQGFAALAESCRRSAAEMRTHAREALLADGKLELQGKLEREFRRIDAGFSEGLREYSGLHRRLDDLAHGLQSDYERCAVAPPEVPGWTSAVESIAALPSSNDANVQKVLDGIRKSLHESERKALRAHRDDTARRQKILTGMQASLKEVRGLLARVKDAIGRALETAARVDGYVDDYAQIWNDEAAAARRLSHSAWKLFLVSLVVLGIALGGAFVNFQLIALPMSELVPAGSRLGGLPVATVAALVIVLMEVVAGMFAADMLGITELFPRLGSLPAARRRLVLGVALTGLLVLACVESSLAVLREQIVEAEAALKLSLAGEESAAVAEASRSAIPVVGQAVLGFVLPWLLALVAVPLEMLLDSGRHAAAALAATATAGCGHLARLLAHVSGALGGALPSLYDVYVAVPLRIERGLRSARRGDPPEDEPEASAAEGADRLGREGAA